MKKILFSIFCFIVLTFKVSAITYNGCQSSDISRLRALVNNVNIYYDYYMVDGFPYFTVTLTNVPDGVYFVDTLTKTTYSYANTINGEISIPNYSGSSGKYKFYTAIAGCYGTKLSDKYYKFPDYNIYYQSDLCKDIPNYSLCQKWIKNNYTRREMQKLIYEYKNPQNIEEEQQIVYEKTWFDKIIDFYVKYYYIFLGVILVICLPIIIIKNKRDTFKL